MRSVLSVLIWLCLTSVAWAEYRKTPGTRFDLSELTSEFKQVVPALEGCNDTNGTITCRRLTSDFTDAEKVAMDTAIIMHDPDIKAKRKAEKTATHQTFLLKLCQGAGLIGQDLQDCKNELK